MYEENENTNLSRDPEDTSAPDVTERDLDFEITIEDDEPAADQPTAAQTTAAQPEQPYPPVGSASSVNAAGTGYSGSTGNTSEIVYNRTANGAPYAWNYVEHPQNGEKIRAKRTGGHGLRIFALILAAVFVLSFASLTAFFIVNSHELLASREPVAEETVIEAPVIGRTDSQTEEKDAAVSEKTSEVFSVGSSGKTNSGLSVNQIAQKCVPSSVGIMVESTVSSYFGMSYTSKGVGSGFILSEDGYIATNNHVVKDAEKITVVLNDEDQTEYEATLIGTDTITDIAVVKIEASGLPVAELGDSDKVLVGDLAVAIGTPASIELAGTVTDGIISAVDRKIDITDNYGRVTKTMTLIQTNATINPGNSGGPLINAYGQVIGINTLKLTDQFEGIGFAIPINGAVKIINQLIADGEVSDREDSFVSGAGSIGVQCADISKEQSEYYDIPQGVLVMQVNKGSAAQNAGLRRGDIIIKFEGKEVLTADELNELKSKYKAGDRVTLTVYRDGEGELEITFNLDQISD